ncbi:MAG: XdhC family protein [Phycisphaerae bacterium]|nr:XdhC family protein [Phycisphaerae bacterium]
MDIHQKIGELIERQTVCAVIQVLQAEGSTPLKAGAKAVVEKSGRIWGTIGGGAVEAEAQQRAIQACDTGQAVVFDFHMKGMQTRDHEPVCGGTMRILVNPCEAGHAQVYAEAASAVQARRSGVLVTRISQCTEVTIGWVSADSVIDQAGFPDGEVLQSCLKKEVPALFTNQAGWSEVLVEPILPRPHLVIAGGGHVGQALAQQAVLVGFDVTMLDDRPEFVHPDLYPAGVMMRCRDMAEAMRELQLTPDTFIVIVTRGHQYDAQVLEACINRPCAYIGMIGSQRKIAVIRSGLIKSGAASEAEFDRVHAPIGLAIGSVTAAEIAVSIMAQLIAVRRKAAVTC